MGTALKILKVAGFVVLLLALATITALLWNTLIRIYIEQAAQRFAQVEQSCQTQANPGE